MAVTWKRAGDSIQITQEEMFRAPADGHYKVSLNGHFPTKLLRDKSGRLYEAAPMGLDADSLLVRLFKPGTEADWESAHKDSFVELDENDMARILYQKENQ